MNLRNVIPPHLVDDIGLCYYDPIDEVLKEFDNPSITLTPYEESVRKFYIVKHSNTIKGKTYQYVKVKVNSDVVAKVRVGQGSFDDFPANNETVAFFSHYSNGIIPIEVYTKCEHPQYLEADLEISLEVL